MSRNVRPIGTAQTSHGPVHRRLASLRPREWEVLNLLATGATNADIARSLSLAEGTVRNVIASLTMKLQVVDRTQAALLAAREGLGYQDLDIGASA